ncbi:MAG: hypothetical protein ACTHU0_21445 [Kofleriaceae bacterium]
MEESLEDMIVRAIDATHRQIEDGREAAIVRRYLEDALLRLKHGSGLPKSPPR